MKVTCLRHGQSEFNIIGLCNDDPARNVGLTPLGREQAQRACTELADRPFDAIYCSQLPRTRETAGIINRPHGLELITHAGINDIRSGFDGRPVSDYFQAIAHDRLHARVNGGESLLDHKRRILGFIDWLGRQAHRQVLLVAHEETLRVFAARARGLDDLVMLDLQFGNCEAFDFELP